MWIDIYRSNHVYVREQVMFEEFGGKITEGVEQVGQFRSEICDEFCLNAQRL